VINVVQAPLPTARGGPASVHGHVQAGYGSEADVTGEVYRRVYGAARGVLLKCFRGGRGYPDLKSISLGELREFTYWLFKYRLKHTEKARVASDTRKALLWLKKENPRRPLAKAPGDFQS